jgi:sugar phosphate isomerase/epimerase
MLREIRSLGFDHAELSHGIRISLLPGIFEAVDAGEIRISTLHNFCPLPMGVDRAAPNIFKFTSMEQRERELAFRQTMKTLDTAVRVKAGLVVLHMGAIEMKDYTDKLLDLAEHQQKDTPKYEKLCAEVMEKREARKERHIAAAHELLRRLVREAQSRGIRLGIENREALEEIPLESDFPLFFREFPPPTIAYWHDCGHAQIKENLGFIHHALHLESLADRLAGFHIHDVAFPGRDHLPPGTGMIDFAGLAAMVKPEHIKVLELAPWVPTEDAKRSFEHIQSLWGDV